jgi:hypothetical protein
MIAVPDYASMGSVGGMNIEGYSRSAKTETDLFFSCRPSRLASFNSDTDTAFNFIDEFIAASQLVAIDRRANQFT